MSEPACFRHRQVHRVRSSAGRGWRAAAGGGGDERVRERRGHQRRRLGRLARRAGRGRGTSGHDHCGDPEQRELLPSEAGEHPHPCPNPNPNPNPNLGHDPNPNLSPHPHPQPPTLTQGNMAVGNAFTLSSGPGSVPLLLEVGLKEAAERVRAKLVYDLDESGAAPQMRLRRVAIVREASGADAAAADAGLGRPGTGLYDVPAGDKEKYCSLYCEGGLTLVCPFVLPLAPDDEARGCISLDWTGAKMRYQADRKTTRQTSRGTTAASASPAARPAQTGRQTDRQQDRKHAARAANCDRARQAVCLRSGCVHARSVPLFFSRGRSFTPGFLLSCAECGLRARSVSLSVYQKITGYSGSDPARTHILRAEHKSTSNRDERPRHRHAEGSSTARRRLGHPTPGQVEAGGDSGGCRRRGAAARCGSMPT
eukprot:scaffold114973_cov63-Phaeocystis_antarctica.AAC.3